MQMEKAGSIISPSTLIFLPQCCSILLQNNCSFFMVTVRFSPDSFSNLHKDQRLTWAGNFILIKSVESCPHLSCYFSLTRTQSQGHIQLQGDLGMWSYRDGYRLRKKRRISSRREGQLTLRQISPSEKQSNSSHPLLHICPLSPVLVPAALYAISKPRNNMARETSIHY